MIALLKSLELVAAALLIGGPAFLRWIWQPTTGLETPAPWPPDASLRRRVRALTLVAFVVLAAAAIADLMRLANQLGAVSVGDQLTMAFDLATGTGVGQLTALRMLLALGLICARPWRPAGRLRTAGLLVLGGGLLLTFSLSGHAAAGLDSTWLSVPADFVHTLCTAAWFGGLCTLVLLPWGSLKSEAVLPKLLQRFSNLGLLSVGLLAVSGTYMACIRLYGLQAFVEHPYGQMLLIKLGFFGGVLALAGVNLLLVRRQRQASAPVGVQPWLRWLITAEAVLGLAVVVAAGTLSTTAPPQGEPYRTAITLTDYHITPAVLEVSAKRPVLLKVTNQGSMEHSYIIVGMPYELISSGHNHGQNLLMIHVPAGQTQTVQFVAPRPGKYQVYCMVEDHAQKGMVATFVVK